MRRCPLSSRTWLRNEAVPGIFAVGDVRFGNKRKRVATAVGDGANAAASVFEYLELQREKK